MKLKKQVDKVRDAEGIFDALSCNKDSITEKMTLKEIERYVNDIVASKTFGALFANNFVVRRTKIKVRGTNEREEFAYVQGDTIYLSKRAGARQITTVLHELAHIVTNRIKREKQSHGPRFCNNYIKLVKGFHPTDEPTFT